MLSLSSHICSVPRHAPLRAAGPVYQETATMLCGLRLHGPRGGPQEQGDQEGLSQRTRRLHHGHQGGAHGAHVPGDCQNGELVSRLFVTVDLIIITAIFCVSVYLDLLSPDSCFSNSLASYPGHAVKHRLNRNKCHLLEILQLQKTCSFC